MDLVSWLQENWGAAYGIGALICAALVWLAVFVGIWWFASAKYALGGLVLGWLPAGIAATLAAIVGGLGWPIILPLALHFGPGFVRAMDL